MLKKNKGLTLPFAMIIAFVMGFLIISFSKMISMISKRGAYLNAMNRVYGFAERGRDATIGALIYDKNLSFYGPESLEGFNGWFESTITPTNIPDPCNYYIVTSATVTIGQKDYSCRLHSRVLVSNIGGYFMIVPDKLTISNPSNLGTGKIYADELVFERDGFVANKTTLKYAEFLTSVDPPLANWTPPVTDELVISDSPNKPVQVTRAVEFPKVDDTALARYKSLAGPHDTTVTVFKDNLFPPGYEGGKDTDDAYADHTDDNLHHIYYSSKDVTIGDVAGGTVTIHGQILIVSEQPIRIVSDIEKSADTSFPGAGYASSSTAHQLVLITPEDIIVSNQYYKVTSTVTPTFQQLDIDGVMLIAANGTFRPEEYAYNVDGLIAPQIYARLSLNFKGAMVLGTLVSQPRFPEIYQNGRTGNYDDTFRTNPPPFIPALAEIYFSLEQSTDRGSIY